MRIKTVDKMKDEINKITPEHREEFCAFITYGEITPEFEKIIDSNKEYWEVLRIAMEIECVDLRKKIENRKKYHRKKFWDKIFKYLGRCFMW